MTIFENVIISIIYLICYGFTIAMFIKEKNVWLRLLLIIVSLAFAICASVAIGECYYETDYYADEQEAIDEQRGCLLAIKEQIERYLATLD